MKDQYGIDGEVRDFNYNELDIFMEYIEYLEDIYEEASNI